MVLIMQASSAEPVAETSSPASPTTGAGQIQLGQYAIPDPVLGMTAWTFVAPVDWTKSGGVYWTGRLVPLAYYSELVVADSRGNQRLELFPTAIFVDTSNPLWADGRPFAPYLQADECVRQMLLPRYRPKASNVRVLAVDKQPRQLLTEGVARARTQGVFNVDVRAARVLLEYQEGERQFCEMFFCTLMALPSATGPRTWCIERALALRAEKMNFEQSSRLLGLVASSLRENQAWVQARGRQLRAMIPAPTPRGSGTLSILDVSRSISRNNDQFLKNIDAINTQRLNTTASDGWTRAFRNTDRRVNPATGQEMDVTGGYLQYYQDYSGRIYGSNDPTDFYQQLKIGGTVLEPAR